MVYVYGYRRERAQFYGYGARYSMVQIRNRRDYYFMFPDRFVASLQELLLIIKSSISALGSCFYPSVYCVVGGNMLGMYCSKPIW
ncbi:hypothetical protein FKM82_009817 [Ascaphus truei]